MPIYKKGEKYKVIVSHVVHGKRLQRAKLVETLNEAKRVEFDLKRTLTNMSAKAPMLTFAEHFNDCVTRMKLELLPSTIGDYVSKMQRHVFPHIGNEMVGDITSDVLHDLIYYKIDGVGPTTRRNILKVLKRIFNMAVERGLVDRSPAEAVKVKKSYAPKTVLRESEMQKLISLSQAYDSPWQNHWAIALLTGMRNGELYALMWDDINLETNTIHVCRNWKKKDGYKPPKNGKPRFVPISAELRSLLLKLRASNPPGYDFVLPHYRDWTNGEQARSLREFCGAINITPIKFHDLRASFITLLLAKGTPAVKVMAIVGHSSLKTTMEYVRLAGVEVAGVTEKLGLSLENNATTLFPAFPGQQTR